MSGRRRPERSDRDWLEDIDVAAGLIEERVRDGKARFLADLERQDSIVRRLEIIGEAVTGLSPQLRERHSEVPWDDIVAFRNRVVHHYFSLNPERVWAVAVEDAPALREQIRGIMAREREREPDGPGEGRAGPGREIDL